MADELQHGQVVHGVAVRRAAGEVEAFAFGERPDGLRLRRPVQWLADEPAGVDAVLHLGNRAEGAGQGQPAGDDARELHRRRGDQPYSLTAGEMLLGQRPGARPDALSHHLVVDIFAERDDFLDVVTGHEGQGSLARFGHVLHALAADPEPHLPPGEASQIRGRKELARRQSLGEVVDRRTLHDGVVDIEERGSRPIDRSGQVRLHLCRRRRSRPSQYGADAVISTGTAQQPAKWSQLRLLAPADSTPAYRSQLGNFPAPMLLVAGALVVVTGAGAVVGGVVVVLTGVVGVPSGAATGAV